MKPVNSDYLAVVGDSADGFPALPVGPEIRFNGLFLIFPLREPKDSGSGPRFVSIAAAASLFVSCDSCVVSTLATLRLICPSETVLISLERPRPKLGNKPADESPELLTARAAVDRVLQDRQ